jgi:cytochrome P450
VNPIIAARRAEGRSDMLSLLLAARDEDGSALSTDDLRNELITFVLAGHETTATTLTWTWYLLAQHPQIEAKIHAEVDRLGDRPLGPDDVHHLPYTEMVLREAMRLYPAALAFGRRPAETLELGGYTIPKGATIFLIPYVTHRNPYYFDRPECFDPERWQNWAGPKGAYFPFGAGSKMCIGEGFARLEALLILATVVRRWRLTFFEHAQEPPPIVLQAAKPIRLTPVRRESRADPLACARLGDRFTAR